MPVEIEVDEAKGRVSLFARGSVGDTDAREAISRLRELATQREDFDFLADASAVDGWPLTTSTIRSIASDGPAFGPHSRRAYVLPSLIAYGLGRMYAAFAYDEPDRVRLFRARADALAWLEAERGSSHADEGAPA